MGELDKAEVRNVFLGEHLLPKVLFICLPALSYKCIIILHECQKSPNNMTSKKISLCTKASFQDDVGC